MQIFKGPEKKDKGPGKKDAPAYLKECYFVQEITAVIGPGKTFSIHIFDRLGVSFEAEYYETLDKAKKACREKNDSSYIIMALKDIPQRFLEKDKTGAFHLKTDNVTRDSASAFIHAIYFLPYTCRKEDEFVCQIKPVSDDIKSGPSNKRKA
jgi:hypothetical protein